MADLSIKEFVFRKGAAKRIPVSGTFELTSRCNLNCKMCYIHMSGEEQCRIGRELTTQEWISLAREAVDAGMIYLLLTGGEPLLRPDFLELYTAMIQMGLLITINTNGTRITPEIAACLREHPPERVNITLYGMSEDTYGSLCGSRRGFSDALRGIRMLKEAGIRVNLNTTFTRYNLDDMEAIVAFAKEETIPVRMSSFIFPPVRNGHEADCMNLSPEELGSAAARFDRMTLEPRQAERRRAYILDCTGSEGPEVDVLECKASSCMAGRGAFWVSWDGKLYPCGMLSDQAQDVRAQGFRDAWQKTGETVRQLLLPAECSGCRYKKICPACAAVFQTMNHSTDTLAPELCRRTKAYVETFLDQGLGEE